MSNTTEILIEFIKVIGELVDFPFSEDVPLTRASLAKAARGYGLSDIQFNSTLHCLKQRGYVKSVDEGDFLITPKGIRKAVISQIENEDWSKRKWDGKWRIAIFDIPESKRGKRDAYRSFLKRKGFVQLQRSVFVAPFGDFNELDYVRRLYGVEKYVNLLIAESASVDDDRLLKKRFGL